MEKSPLGARASASRSPAVCSSLARRVEEPGGTSVGKRPRTGADEEGTHHSGAKKESGERGEGKRQRPRESLDELSRGRQHPKKLERLWWVVPGNSSGGRRSGHGGQHHRNRHSLPVEKLPRSRRQRPVRGVHSRVDALTVRICEHPFHVPAKTKE